MRRAQTLRQTSATTKVGSRADLALLLGTTPEFVERVVECIENWYLSFEVPKASGGMRTIRPPKRPLRKVQRILLKLLYKRLYVAPYLHGGIPKRSIFTHARVHVGKAMVATLDVRNFFPSTREALIRPVFERADITDQALDDVVRLTVLENGLPQGAPTSCLLANLAFAPVDQKMIALCRPRRLSYTRYVDDIAISGDQNFRELKGPCIDRIRTLEYDVADKKVRFMRACERQVVTGLIVNSKLRPTREWISQLKADIWMCLEYGPQIIADMDGIAPSLVKTRLNGRVTHLASTDPKSAKHLKGLLCGVPWAKRC